MTALRRTAVFLTVAAVMAGLIGYYALLTRLAFAAQARRVLAVHFMTVAAKPGEAFAIWLHNSRLVAGVAVCILVSGLARTGREGLRRPFSVSDALLTVWAVGLAALTGVLLGAYGGTQVRVFWPYAPVELAGWVLLLAVYTNARLRRHGWRQTVHGILTVEVLLAVAAVLEAARGRWL